MDARTHLVEPRSQTIGDAVQHPYPCLIPVLHRIRPAMWCHDAHVEYAADRLAAQGRAILLAVLAVGPWRHRAATSLPVGEERRSKFADDPHIEPAIGTARIGDVARARIDLTDFAVPEPPQVEQPLLAPYDVLSPRRITLIVGTRQIHARERSEIGSAVLAVAHPGAFPSITEDPADLRKHADDFPGDLGHELEVVWAERASHPHLRALPM